MTQAEEHTDTPRIETSTAPPSQTPVGQGAPVPPAPSPAPPAPPAAPPPAATPPAPAEAAPPADAAPADKPPPPTFVYAVGQVEPRFGSVALEKEFAQAVGRTETAGQTDREALRSVLAERSARYLARQMCWVFTIEGFETYLLAPRDPADYDLLIDAVRPEADTHDVDVVIGLRGPTAPPEACNGLLLPIVAFDQLYSFDREELIKEIPRPKKQPEDKFRATAVELFDRIGQVADNAGATDEHRALNYLAVRYDAIYARAAEAHADEASLSGVEVRPSRLSGARTIMDVIFSFTHRRTDTTEKSFVRVDVTEEFPFLVTKLSPFYDR
ncbi:cyanobactin maturation protease PatG family protein [Streptomyces sp. NPDC002067]